MSKVGAESAAYEHLALAMGAASLTAAIDNHSQKVDVPIDEKRALTLKVSPTFYLDEVNSVTLKSFRKILSPWMIQDWKDSRLRYFRIHQKKD